MRVPGAGSSLIDTEVEFINEAFGRSVVFDIKTNPKAHRVIAYGIPALFAIKRRWMVTLIRTASPPTKITWGASCEYWSLSENVNWKKGKKENLEAINLN